MFTQCPQCDTIFELGIDELKAAEGQVCCGECNTVFNALASLSDLPANAREQLQELANDQARASDAGPVMVSGDLFEDATDEAGQEAADGDWAPDGDPLTPTDADQLERARWQQKLAELGLDDSVAGQESDETQSSANDSPVDPEAAPGRSQVEAEGEEFEADWMHVAEQPRKSHHWMIAATLAGVALLLQAAHFWRVELAEIPAIGSWLRPLYASLDAPLPDNWDVGAYVVAKDTISNHPEVTGALLVNASVTSNAARPQPYPLLKITLLDRWGEPIGERFFAPAEYLNDSADAASLIEPGDTHPASVLIMDPGAGAVSYGIDACLRDRNNRLLCAHGRDY